MTNLANKPTLTAPLNQFFLAPENARFHVSTDDDSSIDGMANSLAPDSSGQILAVFARGPLGDEVDGLYILDGRRRKIGFDRLLGAERISFDHPVSYKLCETEEEIAAACLAANTQREQLTEADMLIAVNKQTAAGNSLAAIAKILCVDIKEVARLSKLGSLDIRFLEAFKAKKITMSTLKKLAPLTDPAAIDSLADTLEAMGCLYGHYIDRYLAARESINSPVFHYVGHDEYRAKGGRVDEDLFEAVGDAILDPQIAYTLLEAKFKKTLKALRSTGVDVIFLPYFDNDLALPDRQEVPYGFESATSEEDLEAADDNITEIMAQASAARDAGNTAELLARTCGLFKLRFEKARLEVAPLELAAIQFGLTSEGQFEHVAYVRADEYEAHEAALQVAAVEADADEDLDGDDGDAETTADRAPATTKPIDIEVETDGLSASVHATLSTMAGMGLAVSLGKAPLVALDIVVSTMLAQVSDKYWTNSDNYVVKLRIDRAVPSSPDAVFLAPIADPLNVFVSEWRESGLHAFVFVQGLDMHRKLELMALVVALQVSTHENSTSNIRRKARFEAALLAEATSHDLSTFWTGDEAFYGQFKKAQLLDFLQQMGVAAGDFGMFKKDRLVREVVSISAEKRFVPPHLVFKRVIEDQPSIGDVEAAIEVLGDATDVLEADDRPNDDAGQNEDAPAEELAA